MVRKKEVNLHSLRDWLEKMIDCNLCIQTKPMNVSLVNCSPLKDGCQRLMAANFVTKRHTSIRVFIILESKGKTRFFTVR